MMTRESHAIALTYAQGQSGQMDYFGEQGWKTRAIA